MIPKIIHYCWFGRKDKSAAIKKCINSWKENLTDYQIIEWNEDNFNIEEMQYVKEAYREKKYAFVSDVARVKALFEIGGIYLDTDVMVYKSFDSILSQKCVFGFEMGNYIATSFMACEKGFYLMKDFYTLYKNISFYDLKGNIIFSTNVSKLTDMLIDIGLKRNNSYQVLKKEIIIYPQEYFSPYDYANCVKNNTENTICEHLYLVSWMSKKEQLKKMIKHILSTLFGKEGIEKIRKLIGKRKK